MRKRIHAESDNKRAVDTQGLMQLLDAGRQTATQIGTAAEAKIKIGRRVLWNVSKIQKYLDSISA